jgi:hypothetical protein
MIELTVEQGRLLAESLPDNPQTVISIFQLRRGLAKAYVIGDPDNFDTAVIDDPGQPGEPMALGSNPAQIATMLRQLPDWFCVNVQSDLAPHLGPLLAQTMASSIRYYGDIYHTLALPAPPLKHPAVRPLTPADLPMLETAPPAIRGFDPVRLLEEMMAAAAIVEGQIVAIAQNYALSDRYGDIGVATLAEYRNQGLAAAAASLVACWLQENGRIPVWSCGEENLASLRVAQKLGFHQVSQRTYIILDNTVTINRREYA